VLVPGQLGDLLRGADVAAAYGVLEHDAGALLDVRGRRRGQVEFRQIDKPARLFACALVSQLLGNRVIVDGCRAVEPRPHRRVDVPMASLVEVLRLEESLRQ
jgi:hypothetical protein